MRRALIIDKHPLTRLGLNQILMNENFIEVVEANCDAYSIKQACHLQPELIIIGINQYTELIVLEKLAVQVTASKILAYIAIPKANFEQHSALTCVVHFVSKTEDLPVLLSAIRNTISGNLLTTFQKSR